MKSKKEEQKDLEELAKSYKQFLNRGKTERACVNFVIREAKKHGYKNLENLMQENRKIQPGEKVYTSHMGKIVALFQIGTAPLEEGMNILGSHLDSPRIDIKQVPLYEERGLAYFDTHYYGGIKKYQWLGIPLAIHGVVVKLDGTVIEVCIGEKKNDPAFVITDLLPHLGRDKEEKKLKEFIDAEKMDLLIGNGNNDTVKSKILDILYKEYQIKEEDFISAELEIVPAGKARDCGLDYSMILGYGQDDKSCAFAALRAMLECENPKRTICTIFVDKEEIGSVGATGMHSKFFENSIQSLNKLVNFKEYKEKEMILQNSFMLSCDVTAAYDPMYSEYFESRNSAYLSKGLVLSKFSGKGGKSGGNDANAEYIAKLRQCFSQNNVIYQTAELGAVDRGGGGTIAYIMASYGMQVVDCGIGVLNMHAPWEVISKLDLYEMKKGYLAFLNNIK